jgi:hypothetical protein
MSATKSELPEPRLLFQVRESCRGVRTRMIDMHVLGSSAAGACESGPGTDPWMSADLQRHLVRRALRPGRLEVVEFRSGAIRDQSVATLPDYRILQSNRRDAPLSQHGGSSAQRHLVDGRIRIKKLFYVLRPLLACRWIEETLTQPPTGFRSSSILNGSARTRRSGSTSS